MNKFVITFPRVIGVKLIYLVKHIHEISIVQRYYGFFFIERKLNSICLDFEFVCAKMACVVEATF